ncbi:hypothetical protein [Mangrovicoccus sp. HB161399]|uniref:hypothetical protein n=1 Tax=Mangrovicoccus sp. HB161399 TaxID=2720392 RepID=UPI0015532B44|nr:hypothetical protein [Mangrovicoccus sp. HB161399]
MDGNGTEQDRARREAEFLEHLRDIGRDLGLVSQLALAAAGLVSVAVALWRFFGPETLLFSIFMLVPVLMIAVHALFLTISIWERAGRRLWPRAEAQAIARFGKFGAICGTAAGYCGLAAVLLQAFGLLDS